MMRNVFRMFTGASAALTLALAGLAAPQAAAADPNETVIQVATVKIEPGKLDAYKGEVKKLVGVLKRLGSPANVRMWRTTAAGENTGLVIVGLEYPSAAAWAADQAKVQADAEWNQIMARLPGMRTVVSLAVWKDISPTPTTMAGSGKTLVITGVQVNPGKLEEYRKRLSSMQAITKRLGLTGTVRTWQAQLAGPATGNVAIGAEYADLSTYVAEQAKIGADPEWQKLLAGLDEIRTLQGRWLYEAVSF